MERFKGKVAIVTGAGSGIGAAIAARLIQEGAKVMLAARTESSLEDIGRTVQFPEHVQWRSTDVSDEKEVEELVSSTMEHFGGLHMIVNAAGIGAVSRVADTSSDDWMKVFAVDLHSCFYICRAGIPHIKASGGGSILNISSVGGMAADYGFGAYNAAKAGLINFTRTLALELASDNIRANCISPGLVCTPASKTMPDGFRESFFERIPMGRWAEADEIAGVAAFLLSSDASYITGENLVVDGGMRASTHIPNFVKVMEEGWTGKLLS